MPTDCSCRRRAATQNEPRRSGLKNEGKTLAQEGAGTYNLSLWPRRDNGSALPSYDTHERGTYSVFGVEAEAGAFVVE